MQLTLKEPEFTVVTILLGNDIGAQLVESSRRSRRKWGELFREYGHCVPQLIYDARSGLRTFHHPLMYEFMLEWVRNTAWGICDSGCGDAFGVQVPSAHVGQLARYGGIEAFSVMLGDLAECCSATLGNNDHNREFGLIVNGPAWLELASNERFQFSFERQLRMTMQHEMAHFRHQSNGQIGELHAHARGVAALLWRDQSFQSHDEFLQILRSGYDEITQNKEISRLVLENRTSWRLVRMWMHLFKKYSGSRG